MRRPVELYRNHNTQASFIPVAEAMQGAGCYPNDTCAVGCEALKSFMNSQISASAVDLVEDTFDKVSTCKGPESRSFGRVACGAQLKK